MTSNNPTTPDLPTTSENTPRHPTSPTRAHSRSPQRWSRRRRVIAVSSSALIAVGLAAFASVSAASPGNSYASRAASVTSSDTVTGPPKAHVGQVDPTVTQTQLQQCLAANATSPTGASCDTTVKGLKTCMAQGLQCNAAALAQRVASYPPAEVPAPTATVISKTIAVAEARKASPDATAGSPAAAEQVTYTQAVALVGDGATPLITSTRSVWVVTVTAPMPTMGSPTQTPETQPFYTVVLDGYSGYPIVTAIGVDALR
jgi:hypothetical protein